MVEAPVKTLATTAHSHCRGRTETLDTTLAEVLTVEWDALGGRRGHETLGLLPGLGLARLGPRG